MSILTTCRGALESRQVFDRQITLPKPGTKNQTSPAPSLHTTSSFSPLSLSLSPFLTACFAVFGAVNLPTDKYLLNISAQEENSIGNGLEQGEGQVQGDGAGEREALPHCNANLIRIYWRELYEFSPFSWLQLMQSTNFHLNKCNNNKNNTCNMSKICSNVDSVNGIMLY